MIVGNFRFPGGTSTSVISEVRALHAAGYSVGLMSLASGPMGHTWPLHDGIAALVRDGSASFVPPGTPVSARLCCLHHPAVFADLPAVPLEITSPRFVLVVHHPPVDAAGAAQYDVARIMQVTSALFGAVEWAPVGPKVREAFRAVPNRPPLTRGDWHNVIDVDDYRDDLPGLPRAMPAIGRHSRPEAVKWPDDRETFLAAYPDAGDVRVRLMGWGEALEDIIEARPSNWEVLPFGAMPVPDFLRTLDYFSYFHGEDWSEAFGRSILEAMAAGLVCFLPEHFRPLFGDAAIYCQPSEVLSHVRRLEADRDAYRSQTDRAVACVQARFSPRHAVERTRDLIGPPEPVPTAARAAPPAGVLYLTTNGVGMGHITRCLASARRLGPGVRPVIVTMSKAFDVARSQGIDIEYIPFFRSIGLDHASWTAKVAAELTQVFRYHRPEVFVFDGNVPYDGLMSVLSRFPSMWTVWQRRPLWRPEVSEEYLVHAKQFDVVVEPGELCAPVDRGPTVARQREARVVPNMRFLDRDEALDRRAARTLIGLDPDRPAILLQLGAGNNFDLREVVAAILEATDPRRAARPVQVVFARWRISESGLDLPDHVRVLDAFPIARYLNAFDCAVALAGYNTFHENVAAGLPTLFTANDHPEQDEQWLRADYAALRGLALSARWDDAYQFRRQLGRLLDPAVREPLRMACRALPMANGAHEVARFLEGLAMTRKTSPLAFNADVAGVH